MAGVIAAMGLIILGGIGAVAAMLALDFKRPPSHQRAILRAVGSLEYQVLALRSMLRGILGE